MSGRDNDELKRTLATPVPLKPRETEPEAVHEWAVLKIDCVKCGPTTHRLRIGDDRSPYTCRCGDVSVRNEGKATVCTGKGTVTWSTE